MCAGRKGRHLAKARSSSKRGNGSHDDGAIVQSSPREPLPLPKRYKASKEEMLGFYRQMLLIRRFEERAGQLYGLALIGGFCHLYIGQEAVAVGLQSAMTPG